MIDKENARGAGKPARASDDRHRLHFSDPSRRRQYVRVRTSAGLCRCVLLRGSLGWLTFWPAQTLGPVQIGGYYKTKRQALAALRRMLGGGK